MRKVVEEEILIAEIEWMPAKREQIAADIEIVERYMEIFDILPPVRVHRVQKRLLLADGYHRCAAAAKLGRTLIKAIVIDITNEPMPEYNLLASQPWSKQ